MRCSLRLLLLALLATITLSGCGGGASPSDTPIFEATGHPKHVVVVADRPLAQHPLGDTLRAIFEAEYPYLPQAEPRFDLSFVTRKQFAGHLETVLQVLLVEAGPEHPECAYSVERDRWANGQSVITLRGPNLEALLPFASERGGELLQHMETLDQQRRQAGYAAVADRELVAFLEAKYGVHLDIPKGYAIRRNERDFTWISRETSDISVGLLVHRRANRGHWLSPDSALHQRDTFTRAYLPGPTAGSYMRMADALPPRAEELRHGDDTVLHIRGLWEMEKHPMGGPMLSYTRLRPARDSVLTVGGYVYAPRYQKRDYMRELEAILQSYRDVER